MTTRKVGFYQRIFGMGGMMVELVPPYFACIITVEEEAELLLQ